MTLTLTNHERIANEARADVVRLFMPYPVPAGIEGTSPQDMTPCVPITTEAMQDAMREEAEEHYLTAGMRPADRALWIA